MGSREYTLDDSALRNLKTGAMVAARNGHVRIVEILAITGGHIDVVAYFLGSDYHWDAENAFSDALKNEQSEIADLIYENYCKITTRENMFIRLAGNGSTDGVEYLYRKGHDDSDLIGRAFVHAAHHIDTTEYFALTGTCFTCGFEKAAQIGSMGSLEHLYNEVCASTMSLNKAFDKATQKIRSESIIAAFCAASQRGNMGGYASRNERHTVMEFLYKHSYISTEMINKTFLIAAKSNDCATAKLLLDDNRLSASTIVEAFGIAVANGWQDIMMMLRSKEQISTTVILNAFAGVVKSGYGLYLYFTTNSYGLYLVPVLYDEQHTPDEMVCEAFRKAADCGNMQIMEFLFK
ncbi:LOW QUALITY PROTEIN: Hypothetical protein PHPALM_6743 [Phytophthora palmivora]|uniref:Ankyrin repeat protein n=1 Tax=Phytophthora palmivora TaxID=4796 RepID=A0A2P4YE16_9STRA|nr:LOW QUALITY PROTEIN: Hypothetical protein PHPALM_6743 [Phytophthora palmivora]